MTRRSKRGGARPGAGRPVELGVTRPVPARLPTVDVAPEVAQALRAEAARERVSLAEIIRRALRFHVER